MRIIAVAVTCTMLSTGLLADGSTYSRYGIGDLMDISSESRIGAAGVDLSNLSPQSINRLNPAGLTGLRYVRFSGAFSYNSINSKDAIQSATVSSGSFNGMDIALPVSSKYGISISAGLAPYSSVNYKVRVPSSLYGTNYDVDYIGAGGLTRASFSVAGRPFSTLSLGCTYAFLLGNLRTEWQTHSTDANFFQSDITQSVEARGSMFTVGAIYTGLGSFTGMKGLEPLSVGGVVTTSAPLSTTSRYVYDFITGRDTTAGIKGTMTIPMAYGFGLSYLVNDRLTIAADLYAQQWSKMETNGAATADLRNSVRYAIGAEYIPIPAPEASYVERLIFRLGTAYNQTYYKIQGEPINELQFTAGIGLPIIYDTRLNVAFGYSIRGTAKTVFLPGATPLQFVQDHILQINIGLSIGELWFVQSQDE